MKYFNFLFYLNIIFIFILNKKNKNFKNDLELFFLREFLKFKINKLIINIINSLKINLFNILLKNK